MLKKLKNELIAKYVQQEKEYKERIAKFVEQIK